jgi:hypothetical protein
LRTYTDTHEAAAARKRASKETKARLKRLENAARAQILEEWKKGLGVAAQGLAKITQQLVW